MPGPTVFIAVGGAIFALVHHLMMRASKRQRLSTVVEAFRLVGGVLEDATLHEGVSEVRGLARGMPTTFRFATRGAGSNSEPWTEVDVRLRGPTRLRMELRPQTDRETRLVADGRAVDVQLGDPRFDPLFVVEAAPAAVVRALLSVRARERLVALHPCEVTQTDDGFRLAKAKWQEQGPVAVEMVDLLSGLVSRIDEAFGALEEARLAAAGATDEAGAYRGAAPERLQAVAQGAADGDELGRLEDARSLRQRGERRTRILLLLLVLGLVFGSFFFVSAYRC